MNHIALDKKPEIGNYKDPEPLEPLESINLDKCILLVDSIIEILQFEKSQTRIYINFAVIRNLVRLTRDFTVARHYIDTSGLYQCNFVFKC